MISNIYSPISNYLQNKKNISTENIKGLFPNNMTSNAYISDVAKKSHKKIKNIKNKKVKVFFPKFDGKIYDPTLNKALNVLKLNEEQLQKEIQKRKNNINLLKGEVSLNNVNNNHELEKEKKKAEDKIKLLERENSISIEKLEEIKNRRNVIQYQLDKELGILDIHKKMQLNKFNEDLNNKEKMGLFEDKMKKLHDESKKLHLKMQSDLEKAIDKRNTKMDKMEKEKEEKILKFRKDMKDKEREDIKKRNLKAKEEILKLKELQNNKKPKVGSNLYKEIEDKFLKHEENLIKNENQRRKELMRHINLNEFYELAKNYDEMKTKQIYESKLRCEREKEIWSQRKKLIPDYVNPLTKLIEEEKNRMKQEEKKEILEKEKYKKLQMNYKAPKPLIIKKEKTEINDKDKKNKKGLIKSSSYSDILRQKMLIKFNTSKNKKEKQKESKENEFDKNIINFRLPLINLKEKYRKINKSFEKDKNNNENHELTTDYLNQRRIINEKNREKKRNNGEISTMDSKSNDIKKLIKENGFNESVLKMAKSKLETLDEKKNQKSLLLKLNGGVANKPELGEEICDLIIDSIQARLSIIKEFENMNGSNNENNENNENDEE